MKLIYAAAGFLAGVAVALATSNDRALVATSALPALVTPAPVVGTPDQPGDDYCRWYLRDMGPAYDYDSYDDDALVWICNRTDVRVLRGSIN